MKLIRTPVPGVNDTVGTVKFVDGVAKVDDAASELGYFRSAGYGVDDFDEALDAAKSNPDDTGVAQGLEKLDTQAGDSNDDPLVVRDVDGDGVDEVLPRKAASAETWRAFAVEHGMHEDEARQKTRDELAAYFTQDKKAASK